jgi:hypothetical protein
MNDLLRSFGVPVAGNIQVSAINLAFHGLRPSTALIIAAIIIAATVWTYLRTTPRLSKVQKTILVLLRCLLLAMIVLMLMRPILLLTVEGTIRRSLLVLIDSSASMQIKDLRQDADDVKRAAIAQGSLDPKGGLTQGLPPQTGQGISLSRAEVVKAMLTNSRLQLLDTLSQTYDVVPYTFGQTLQAVSNTGTDTSAAPASMPSTNAAPADPNPAAKNPTSFLDAIPFDKPYTAIGDAVRSLLDLKRGQPLAGIFLITDGGNNYGSQPLDAAALAQQDKVPLYIYGVGISSPHDIIVSQVYAPEVEFAGEDETASVTVRSQSMKGRSARMELKLGDHVVASQDVTFGEDGEQVIPVKFQPKTKGEYDLTASIAPLADEAIKDNNTASQRVRVIDGKVQVLYVEEKPRWEFRYLQAMLIRDKRIDAHFYLVDGDPELSKEAGSPYLDALPSKKDDWMKYDVVIIGDVDGRLFNYEQMQSMVDLVSTFGGGVIFLAGSNYMPDSYRRTPLETLFPVEFESKARTHPPCGCPATTTKTRTSGKISPAFTGTRR